jgi:hypothetical protein
MKAVQRIIGGSSGIDVGGRSVQVAMTEMRKISLRRLVAKLTVLALSASAAAANADEVRTTQAVIDDIDLADDSPIDRESFNAREAAQLLGRTLAQALSELPPLDATHVATTWALSEDVLRRAAVASSLEWAFPLVGDGTIIEHLARDVDPGIRAACARAAWIRRPTGGDQGVLARLSRDPDPEVRGIAQGCWRP